MCKSFIIVCLSQAWIDFEKFIELKSKPKKNEIKRY